MARRKSTPVLVDAAELVEQNWPYDGPHSPDGVIEAARMMDGLARYLGNATGPGNGTRTLQYGPHVCRVLGALTSTLASLDQVFEQLATAEQRIGADPLSYDHGRDRPASDTTDKVIAGITAARELLFQDPFFGDRQKSTVHTHLEAAYTQASRIGHDR